MGYAELVKELRESAANKRLMTYAADAIDELQKVANKLLAKYQEEATAVIWEYSGHIDESLDYLEKEVIALQAQINSRPKPPKEETE